MRLPLPSRRPSADLSDGQRGARLIIRFIVQLAVMFMVLVAVIFAIVALVSGSSIVVPRSADGVLKSVKQPDHYGWTSETVRKVNFGAGDVEQQALRSVVADLKLNRFQAVISGVLPERTTFVSAGKTTRAVTASDEQQGAAPQVINRVCAGEPAMPAASVAFPTAAELLAAHPKLVSDAATVQGQRAWMINFTPDKAIVGDLLLMGFLDKVTANFGDLAPWVMSKADRAALAAGRFKVDYAHAWVTREDRYLAQIEVKLRMVGGSAYRILAVLHPDPDDKRPLDNLATGAVNCTAAASSSATAQPAAAAQPTTVAP